MTGLFYDIRGYFDQRYSGRYISQLLRELARHEPSSFCKILAFAAKSCKCDWHDVCAAVETDRAVVECEYSFAGQSRQRRADLAVLQDGQAKLFIEVKEDDAGSPGNAAQTRDYLSQGLPFVHLSRFPPEGEDGRTLAKAMQPGRPVASIRYRDVHRILRNAGRPIARMLCDYLEDIEVGTYLPIDLRTEERALAFMLTQILGFPHAAGLGKLTSKDAVSAIPQLLKRIFDNLEYVAEWAHQANRSSIKTRFIRRLRPHHSFRLGKLATGIDKALKDGDRSEVDFLPGDLGQYLEGGEVDFCAIGTIGNAPGARPKLQKADWLPVELGFAFEIRRGGGRGASEKRIVRPYLYTSFYGRHLREHDASSETDYLTRFPSEEVALRGFRDCLTEARRSALGATEDEGFRTALKGFRIPPLP